MWKYFLKLSSWEMVIKKRKTRQSNRRISERFIVHRFTGSINFQDVMSPAIKYIANPILSAYWFIVRIIVFW